MRRLTPWTFGKILRDPLRSWGFHFEFFCVQRSWRKIWSFWKTWYQLPCDILGLFRLIFSTFYALVVRLIRHPDALLWRSFYRLLYLGLSAWKGIQSSWRDCFATVSDVPGRILPAFFFCRYLTKKVLAGSLLFSMAIFIV